MQAYAYGADRLKAFELLRKSVPDEELLMQYTLDGWHKWYYAAAGAFGALFPAMYDEL